MKSDIYGRMKSYTIKELSQEIDVNVKTIRKHIDLIRSGTDLSRAVYKIHKRYS